MASRKRRGQERTRQSEHILRLATEIATVSRTIESDLAPFGSIPALARLQSRSRRVRLRAEAVLGSRERLRDLPWFELEAQVASVHTDHLHMVELRAVADLEITGWRKHRRKSPDSVRSTWPFRSTSLGTSTLDA